jgi:hypothetical protein
MLYGSGFYGGRGGRGRRNMYYLTGLPGWMRAMSPGGPCAQFLLTGQWPTPQMQTAWQAMQAGQPVAAPGVPVDARAQLGWLRTQAQFLQQQLEQVQARIAELERQSQ